MGAFGSQLNRGEGKKLSEKQQQLLARIPEAGAEGCRIAPPTPPLFFPSVFAFVSHSLSPSYFSCFFYSLLLGYFVLPR